ncbi:unnamed protein product [Natator depressus]
MTCLSKLVEKLGFPAVLSIVVLFLLPTGRWFPSALSPSCRGSAGEKRMHVAAYMGGPRFLVLLRGVKPAEPARTVPKLPCIKTSTGHGSVHGCGVTPEGSRAHASGGGVCL